MKKKLVFLVALFVFVLQATVFAKTIKFVSSDVSAYPRVKVFYKVYDNKGVVIQTVKFTKVTLLEKVPGGTYLEREVKAHEQVSDGVGLSTGLVADKSGSIREDGLKEIKNILKQYVSSMKLENGDKAELISFNDTVTTDCDYTNNINILLNAIDSIVVGGNTALYDAIYEGIYHAASQNGVRCVIAFTDGQNNSGTKYATEVINYSKNKQVPVYIVGVGNNVSKTELENIANKTGGKYWHINSLQDFYQILMQIYLIERSTYYFEYITDIPKNDVRNIHLTVNDGSETIETEDEVKPVINDYKPKDTNDNSKKTMSDDDYANEIPTDLTYAGPGSMKNKNRNDADNTYGVPRDMTNVGVDNTYAGPSGNANVGSDNTYAGPDTNMGQVSDNTYGGPDMDANLQIPMAGPDTDMNLQQPLQNAGPHIQ